MSFLERPAVPPFYSIPIVVKGLTCFESSGLISDDERSLNPTRGIRMRIVTTVVLFVRALGHQPGDDGRR